MTTAQITIPLGIPEIKALYTQITEQGEFLITVESTLSAAQCHRCGREIRQFHGHDKWVTVRHLPILGRATYLRYRPKRYRCDDCDGHPTTTQQLSWHGPNSPHTTGYDTHLLLQMVNATIEDVSIKEGLSHDAVLAVVERRIADQVDWAPYTELDVLGLDEIARKEGYRGFAVIMTARLRAGRIAMLGVLPDREKATVKRFLADIPAALREAIQTLYVRKLYSGRT